MPANPFQAALKCDFILDKPINEKKRRHIGVCICGIRGSCSYDSFVKQKFCRNEECEYHQPAKRLDNDEMLMIIEERECQLVSLTGSGSKAQLEFICCCGFRQTSSWYHFYRDKWCHYYKCEYYHSLKNLDTQLAKAWIEYEGYNVPKDFNYDTKQHGERDKHYQLTCPLGHIVSISLGMWKQGARCKICHGNGRTLGFQEIKRFYESHDCKLLYSEEDFVGNVTKIIVPYICPKGHTINNMTKNNFNTRINNGIGPCAVCREEGRNRKKENVNLQKAMVKKYGVKFSLQVPEIYAKQQKSMPNIKLYLLPSGKKIKLQGYEPRCIDILLEDYNEDQILSDSEDMPEIWYFNPLTNNRARYYPDMYLPDINCVIEVKSTWTYEREKERNIEKFRGTVKAGYDLHLYVFDERNLLYREIHTKDSISVHPHPPVELVFEE